MAPLSVLHNTPKRCDAVSIQGGALQGTISLPLRFQLAVQFAADDPARPIARLDDPFFQPEMPYEKTGQYAAGTTFVEGLAYMKGVWFLYYGAADSTVGVARTR